MYEYTGIRTWTHKEKFNYCNQSHGLTFITFIPSYTGGYICTRHTTCSCPSGAHWARVVVDFTTKEMFYYDTLKPKATSCLDRLK